MRRYMANIIQHHMIEDLRIMFATVKILFVPKSTEGIEQGKTNAMDEIAGTKDNNG